MVLLSESDSESESGELSFGVNKEFAKKYEEKKRTEELSKLQDKYGPNFSLEDEEEEDSEDLSTDDEDAELVTPQVDIAILRTLARIKQKDPAVYEDGRQVFDEEEKRSATVDDESSKTSKKSKSSKPVLLKDYQRARLLEDPTGASLNDDNSNNDLPLSARTFAQEERDLKAEVKKAFGGDDEDEEEEDDLLVPRTKTREEREREDREYEEFLKKNVGDREVEDALEADESFLRGYILNRGWIDRSSNKSRIPSYNEITGGTSPPPEKKKKTKSEKKKNKEAVVVLEGEEDDREIPDPGQFDSEDSDFEEKAEEFEQKYNFRFEEEAGPSLVTHSRDITAAKSVRKPTTAVLARERQREAAKERKEQEKLERKEEVRRLKALKRKEVEDKLKKILETAGEGVVGVDEIDLEGDWDEEEHDRKMKELYGGGYDEADDADFKPTWDDDIDISDLVGADGEEDVEMDDGEAQDPSAAPVKVKKDKKGKRKREEEGFPADLLEAAKNGADDARKKILDQMVDDYYGLDYEDKIEDLPTRFKYTKVAASSYALTPAEILLATDAELNSYMSLRKMAPYRPNSGEEEKLKKKKLKELRDALKNREWGEEVDEEEVEARREKKERWRAEGKSGGSGEKTKKKSKSNEEGGEVAKRLGKKERQRRKAAASQEGGASTSAT